MSRRQVTMNEIVEMIFQWHQGAGFKQIERSLGFDRNTVRKYIRLAQVAGVARGTPFPPPRRSLRRSSKRPGRLLF